MTRVFVLAGEEKGVNLHALDRKGVLRISYILNLHSSYLPTAQSQDFYPG